MKALNALSALAAALVVGFGCQPAEDTPLETNVQPARVQPRGPGKLVVEALAKLDLSAEQRTRVNAQVAASQKVLEPVRLAQAGLMAEASEQLRAGRIDDAKLKVLIGDLRTAFDNARPTLVASLNDVHATLSSEQRKELIAQLREQHRKLRAQHLGPEGERGGFRGFHRHGRRHRLRRLVRFLGLTEDQRVQIGAEIERLRQGEPRGFYKFRERIEDAVRAFESDTFDAAKLPFLNHPHERGLKRLDKVLQIARAVLPMLSREQRNALADEIDERADWVAPTE